MPICDECGGEYDTLKNQCKYCEDEFCPEHRLPEKHDCPGLNELAVGTRHFESAGGDTGTRRTLREPEDDDGPEPMDDVRTHGGSGRDRTDDDYVSSPDVNPDGSLEESEVTAPEREYANADEGRGFPLSLGPLKRRKFLSALGFLGIGGATAGLVQNGGDVDATVEDGQQLWDDLSEEAKPYVGGLVGVTLDDGTRVFGIGSGGFQKVTWHESGDLFVDFEDNPDMQTWALVGPEPERNVLDFGTPDSFGGRTRVELDYPLKRGEYSLVGTAAQIDRDGLIDAERTGTANLPVQPRLEVGGVAHAGDGAAAVTVRNPGTAPIQVVGVTFDGVPNAAGQRLDLEGGETLVLPGRDQVVTTAGQPFLDDSEVRVPDEFEVRVRSGDGTTW